MINALNIHFLVHLFNTAVDEGGKFISRQVRKRPLNSALLLNVLVHLRLEGMTEVHQTLNERT